MSDQQHTEKPQSSTNIANDEPPTEQSATMNPPSKPVSDLATDSAIGPMNTSEPSGTTKLDDKTNTETSHNEGDSGSLKPASLIPGLSLVNDNKLTEQPATNEPSTTDKKDVNIGHIPNSASHEGNMAAPDAGDAMDVTEDSAVKPPTETAETNVDGRTGGEKELNASSNQQEIAEREKEIHDRVPVATDSMDAEQTFVQSRAEGVKENGDGHANIMDTTGTSTQQETEKVGEEEHPEWESDSSPYESSSDDSSTDSSDDSDEDDEDHPILSPEEQARILMQEELGSDDEGDGKGKAGGHIKTANEVLEDVPPIPDITVTPEMKITLLGHASTVVDNAVLIEASTTGEYQVLESGSLLCLEDRSVIGVVCETLGRVEQPLYTVLYANRAEVEKRGLTRGKPIYYVDSHSTFVFTQPLKGLKGSDASNFHDEEIGEDEVEFSDDEAEAEHKKKLKQKKQEKRGAKAGQGGPSAGRRGPPGPSKLGQTELNYDDVPADDGYTPLARPKNLHEIMGNQEAPVENAEFSGRGGFRGGRGRGRGSDRGRGRGRGGGPGQPREDRRQQRQQHQHHPLPAVPQPPISYAQPAYPQSGQPAYGTPQYFPPYAPYQPPQPYGQPSVPSQFPFPNPLAYQPPNPYQQVSPGPHVNPLFFAALQQQQQQPQYQQPQPPQPQPQPQNQALNFDQVKAQLDILQQLSNGAHGPRQT